MLTSLHSQCSSCHPLPFTSPLKECLPSQPLGIALLWGIKSIQDQAHPLPLGPDQAVSPQLCMCWEPQTSQCMLFVGGLVPGVQVSWPCWSSCGIAIPFSSFSLSPNSSIGIPNPNPIVGCGYLHLSQSASGRASQRTAMLSSCLQAHRCFSFSNGCQPVQSFPCGRTMLLSIRKWGFQAHQSLMLVVTLMTD